MDEIKSSKRMLADAVFQHIFSLTAFAVFAIPFTHIHCTLRRHF